MGQKEDFEEDYEQKQTSLSVSNSNLQSTINDQASQQTELKIQNVYLTDINKVNRELKLTEDEL